MRKLLLRAALACALTTLLADCAQEEKEQELEPGGFFSESNAVATTQALLETPTACGASFETKYREHVLPMTGSYDLVLPGLTTRPWPQQLLHYRVRVPAGLDATKLTVRGPGGSPGPLVTRQVDICRVDPANGDTIVRLTFFGDQPAGTANTTYKAQIEPGYVQPPNGGFAGTAANVQLSNAWLAVRTPPLGEQNFAGVDLSAVAATAAPILEFRLNDGTWVLPSSFEGTKRKVTSLEVFEGTKGPLMNEVLLAYEFAPTDPTKPPGYWRVAIRVVSNIPMVFIEEEYDFGDEKPETQVDKWVVKLSNGWNPSQLTAAWSSHSVLGTSGFFLSNPDVRGIDSVALTATGVDFTSMTPYYAAPGEQFWSGVYSGSSRFAGVVPLFGGAWRRYPKMTMHAGTSDTTLRFELGITTPHEPSYQLSTGGDDLDLPRSTARRQWGLVLGPTKTSYELFALRGRYGSLSMNDIKEWQLDWPGIEHLVPAGTVPSDPLAVADYPSMVLTPLIASQARAAYNAGTLPQPVQSALSKFYRTTGNTALADQALAEFNGYFDSYINNSVMFGGIKPPTETIPTTYSPFTHYRTGQFTIATMLSRAEDYLAKPSANPTEMATRKTVLQKLAMAAHLFSRPEYAPIVSGIHQGNPNMPLDRMAGLPVLTQLIPNHPLAATFRNFAFDYYKLMAETFLSTGGAFRESSPNYQNAAIPFLEFPMLAFERAGLSIEPQAFLENATRYQVGTTTPIVGRYGLRIWDLFGHGGLAPVSSPLITAAIYDERGLTFDHERAQQAIKAWEFGGSVCADPLTYTSGCMLAAYAAVLGPNNPQTVDASSKFLPGMGVSMRGRPGALEESFVMLRGGYNASHMDAGENGAFAFHTAGDELIGFPDSGYITNDGLWTVGKPWSGITGSNPAVNGEWTDPGFTEVADYAFFNTGLTRTGYGPGGWIRQAMLVKGEQAGEYDYVMFRDVRPYGTETISSIHLGTRLPSSSWATTASPAVATVTGRHGGRARFRPLDPIAGTFGSTVGITYPLNEQPHCRLREAFSGGNSGRPESPSRLATVNATLATINTTQPGGCMTNGTAAHSSIDFNLTTTAKNATWMLQGGFGGSIDPTVTQLAPGVFKVSNSTGSQRDYVFISDDRIEWSGTDTYQTTSSPVSFKGNAGVIRVRGTQVALSLNAGKGEVKHGLHTLTGEGPRLCRGTVGAANACTAPPSAPYTIPAVSCTPVTVAPRVTVCTNTGTKTTQYRVLNDSTGVPVDYKAPDSSITIDGIVDGAITIAPYHTNFTVLAGSGLFQASGKTIIGGGPFTVDSYPDRIEGNTEGRPRALWVDGLHVPSRLMVDGVNVTNEEIPTIWMTSVGLTGGPQAFEITKLENRLRSMPHLNYTLDRITGRAVATPRQAPPGAMVFSGYGDFSDSARWSPHAPVAGDTVFIPANSGVALLSDTPQLASIIVDGAITVHTSTARLRATDVELCGTLTHAANMATAAVSGAWPIDAKISIEATNFKLCSTGVIDVSGKGYQARVIVAGQGYSSSSGYGPSGGQGGAHGSGAGHGGAGGRNRDWDLIGGAAHDSVQHPIQPGSAGGSNGWDSFGGAGGGVVRIAVTGRATIDGIIAADGLPPAAFVPSNPTHSGGGSGGAVEIVCNELVGSGLIRANGGGPSGEGGGGGAGGRIAVSYVNLPAPMASLRLSAAGGRVASTLVPRGEDGELGTVYLPDARFFPGVNVIDSAELVLGSTAAIQRASLTVRDAALHLPAGVPVRIDGALSVRGSKGVLKLRGDASAASVDIYENSRVELISPAVALPNTNGRYGSALRVAGMLYVRSGATIVPRSDKVTGVSPQIFAQNLEVQTTAAIAADATGFGCCDAMGHGYGPGWGAYNGSGVAFGKGGGGDYGGLGGTATGGLAGGTTYGTSTSPEQPGSAGGTGLDTNWPGGAGGGLAYLSVAGTARIDGLLTANGASSPRRPNNGNLSWAGAGAGGTVYLVCNTFAGSGAIRARGGAPSINGGGGGGGRIAIYRTTSQWLGEAITASGSTSGGSVTPVNGTVPGALGSVSNAFNAAPTITLTPAASTVFFAAPGGTVSIPLAATASDSDGTIARVSFYADNVLISDDLSSPYAFTWSSVAPGTHTLFAVAQDNRGMTVSTTPIPVEVWETSDIGSVGVTGSASYSAGSFTITGAGAGITGIADAFRFAYKQINSTSFTITARVPSSGAITAAGRAGLMVREQLTAGSRHASALYSGTAPAVWFHTRATAGGTTNTSSWTSSDRWVRLTRSGNTFTAFRSSNGTTWTQVGTPMSLAMGSSVYVGLAMTSGQNNLNGTATIDSVAMP